MEDIKDGAESPPVGLKLRYLWIEERLNDINDAMVRYAAANQIIPTEWLEEYLQLVNEHTALKNKESQLNVARLRWGTGLPPISQVNS